MRKVRAELRQHGWASVLVVGIVGVDKCLQALSVTDLEVVAQSRGSQKIVCTVRKMPVYVEHERHGGLIQEHQGQKEHGISVSNRQEIVDNIADSSSFPSSRSEARRSQHALHIGRRSGNSDLNHDKKKTSRDGPRVGFVFEAWLCGKEAFTQV